MADQVALFAPWQIKMLMFAPWQIKMLMFAPRQTKLLCLHHGRSNCGHIEGRKQGTKRCTQLAYTRQISHKACRWSGNSKCPQSASTSFPPRPSCQERQKLMAHP